MFVVVMIVRFFGVVYLFVSVVRALIIYFFFCSVRFLDYR